MRTSLAEIITCPEFQKLRNIGGHKEYHLEGNALKHTLLVLAEAMSMFPNEPLMWRVAALHDIGKIYTAIENGPDDWSYPDHALCGSFKGVLCKFISLEDEDFEKIQWYIRNHIKPLFYAKSEFAELEKKCPEGCSVRNLARLAVCDIKGSKSVEPQDALINYLLTV